MNDNNAQRNNKPDNSNIIVEAKPEIKKEANKLDCCKKLPDTCGIDSSLLFFFLILVCLFDKCDLGVSGDTLLLFFLLLVVLMKKYCY